MQQTIANRVTLVGTGLHSGRPARLTICPADADEGISFCRTDITDRDNVISARWSNVTDTVLNTRIANDEGVEVSTVEHLMAALVGCGVHNVRVELDGPEVPIFDGSSLKFANTILAAGVKPVAEQLRMIRISDVVRVERGDAFAELRPHLGFEVDYSIEFSDAAIGSQSLYKDMSNGAFLRELANCRTFCRRTDVEALQSQGLALGGTYENAIVVDGDQVLTPGGFRRDDECVRHKMLDALGDLGLAGYPILGRYVGHKAGHALTNQLLRKLFATPEAFSLISDTGAMASRLPGIDLKERDLACVG